MSRDADELDPGRSREDASPSVPGRSPGWDRATSRRETRVAILLCVLLALAVALCTAIGRESRQAPIVEEPRVTVVQTSAELLAALEATGMRGGTLVSVSRFLHFVPVEGAVPRDALKLPVETFDLVEAHAARVDAKNVLWLALETGVARDVIHVLPEEEYRSRRDALSAGEAGVWLEADRIVTHEAGSRRTIATHVPQERLDGPFLVAIDASYFDGEAAGDPGVVLTAAGLGSGPLILGRAEDNPDVSDLGRSRLDAFAGRWGRSD